MLRHDWRRPSRTLGGRAKNRQVTLRHADGDGRGADLGEAAIAKLVAYEERQVVASQEPIADGS